MKNIIKTPLPISNKIKTLIPGGSIILSKVGDKSVVAERSGDGKTLTIFRESSFGFETIKKTSF